MTSSSSDGYGTMATNGNHNDSSRIRRRRSIDQDNIRGEGGESVQAPRTNDTFLVGVSLLLLVVLLWTSSNFLTNYQLTKGYNKPFAVTYLNTASFSLYLIPFAVVLQQRRKSKRETSTEAYQLKGVWAKVGFVLPAGSIWSTERRDTYAPVRGNDDEEANINERITRQHSLDVERRRLMRPSSIDGRRPLSQQALKVPSTYEDQSPPLDLHQTAVLALHFMIVWFMANYCLNLALKLTSVASATTLSSASGFFTLALGALIGVEIFSFAKLGAVTMSFLGVLMVMRADVSTEGDETKIPGGGNPGNEPALPFAGDMLALASALFYAVYVVLLKFRIGREERVSMPLFFGIVGILSITLMWPIGLILHLTGIELVQLPHGKVEWLSVVVNMAITVISDFAYLLAMLKSSPLVATVGLSLTIPLAIIGDTLLGSHSGGTQAYVGSAVVLSSFVVIGLVDRTLAKRQQQQQ
ncbi:hypothetical protein L7F22_054032 [Adiantum nelumboides]|nr:hypothetical protein [Adiantum nelumboides]